MRGSPVGKESGLVAESTVAGGRRADIQGLRAVAVLLVVAFHAGLPVTGGYVGVDAFFVISGFVITGLLVRELEVTGSINLGSFYARRVRRLLPALAAVSTAVLVASLFVLSPLGSQQDAARTGSAAALFLANIELFLSPAGYFAAPAALNPFLHTWSLSVEEQYYLFFPAFLWFVWVMAGKRKKSPHHFAAQMSAGLTVASFLLCVGLVESHGFPFHGRNVKFAFYSLPTRAWEFGIGVMIALLPLRRWIRPGAATALGVVSFLTLCACAVCFDQLTTFPGAAALLPVCATAGILTAGFDRESFVNRALSVRPLRILGDLSYSWYLWHWPCIVFAKLIFPSAGGYVMPVVAVAALVPAWLSFKFVENPIRLTEFWRGRRLAAVGVGSVALPLACALVLLGAAKIGDASIRDLREQRVVHLHTLRGCTGNLPSEAQTASSCSWHFPGATGKMVLIGDSNAGQFIEGILPAARALHLDVTLATYPGCPFVRIEMSSPAAGPNTGCLGFVAAWTAALAHQRPSLVVIASASADYFIHDTHVVFRALEGGPQASADGDKEELWRKGTSSVLGDAIGGRTRVLLIHTLPHFVDWNIYSCPGFTIYRDTTACGRREDRNVILNQQHAAKEAEQAALLLHRRALGADLFDDVCPDPLCSTNNGNRWLYRDGRHITIGEAKLLTPRLEDFMRSTLNLA